MTDLEKLIAAVEAGEVGDDVFGDMFALSRIAPWSENRTAREAYRGSLDAALRLHEALLPGWDWLVRRRGYACVWETKEIGDSDAEATLPDQPARAWLLSILRALKERGE